MAPERVYDVRSRAERQETRAAVVSSCLDPQVAGREDTGNEVGLFKPQSPSPVTHFFQQGHTS